MIGQKELLENIRGCDMVDYLAGLGYVPVRVRKGYEYWYLSPLREGKTASFKVDRRRNRWYDFGIAAGGNVVDFGLRYFSCGIPELMEKFTRGALWAGPHLLPDRCEARPEENKLEVRSVAPLSAYRLKAYLQERCIPLGVATAYCVQVSYVMNAREWYAIGFKNDAGGYELRNRFAKHSSAPKEVTTMRTGCCSVQVFEGFMDFLSWQVLQPSGEPRATDIAVLNGAAMLDRALPFLLEHERVHLWLDRDATGQRYRDQAVSTGSRFRDESGLYRGFKDLNEWLCGGNRIQQTVKRLKIRP